MIGQADLAETVARVGATYKSGDGVLQKTWVGRGYVLDGWCFQ